MRAFASASASRAAACSTSLLAPASAAEAEAMFDEALVSSAALVAWVMNTVGSSAASCAWAWATFARAWASATSSSVGSIWTSTSPALTRWFSTTATRVTVPVTRAPMLLMSASICASSVVSKWRA